MSFYTGRFYRKILLLHDNDQSPIEKDSIESYILRNSSIGWYLIIVFSLKCISNYCFCRKFKELSLGIYLVNNQRV